LAAAHNKGLHADLRRLRQALNAMDIRLPILHMNADYILPVAEKNYGICGLKNYRSGCYEGARFIDSMGQEWFVDSAEVLGYSSILHTSVGGMRISLLKLSFASVWVRSIPLMS